MKLNNICFYLMIMLLGVIVVPATRADSANLSIHGISKNAPVSSKYALYCGGCHGLDGKGEVLADVPMLPPNIGAFLYDELGPWYLVNVGGVMSAGITDKDAADIMNFVMKSFGEESMPDNTYLFTPEQIAELRANPPDDLVLLRRDIAKRLSLKGINLPDDYPWQ